MAKGHSYQGQHWTQKPENRARLIKMLKRPRKKVSKAEKIVAKAVKKIHKKSEVKETTLVMNGWKVTLGHNTVKIEQS